MLEQPSFDFEKVSRHRRILELADVTDDTEKIILVQNLQFKEFIDRLAVIVTCDRLARLLEVLGEYLREHDLIGAAHEYGIG